jgi:TM2 domain-containing membrane protein YozV
MANILNIMPELQADEMAYVQNIIRDMSDERAQQYANIYRARRRDPLLVLITALLGFVLISGVQRFILGQIGMGLLYFFTGGLCLVGTIIDVINYRRLAFEYNVKEAQLVNNMMQGQYGGYY